MRDSCRGILIGQMVSLTLKHFFITDISEASPDNSLYCNGHFALEVSPLDSDFHYEMAETFNGSP
jgi:hypothetical protein